MNSHQSILCQMARKDAYRYAVQEGDARMMTNVPAAWTQKKCEAR